MKKLNAVISPYNVVRMLSFHLNIPRIVDHFWDSHSITLFAKCILRFGTDGYVALFCKWKIFLQEEQAFLQGKVLTENTSNVKYISAKGIYFSIGSKNCRAYSRFSIKGRISSVQFKKFP